MSSKSNPEQTREDDVISIGDIMQVQGVTSSGGGQTKGSGVVVITCILQSVSPQTQISTSRSKGGQVGRGVVVVEIVVGINSRMHDDTPQTQV